MIKKFFSQKGFSLVTLLVFMIIGITITSAGAVLIYHTNIGASDMQLSERALATAESGVENAIIRLIRDPNYLGENLTIEDGVATIVVTGGLQKTVVSTGKIGNFQRKIEAVLDYNNNELNLLRWTEIY